MKASLTSLLIFSVWHVESWVVSVPQTRWKGSYSWITSRGEYEAACLRSAGRGCDSIRNLKAGSNVASGLLAFPLRRHAGVYCSRGTRTSSLMMAATSSPWKKPWDTVKSFLTFGRKPQPLEVEVAVIGAGIAGLVCARILTRAGLVVKVFEASDGVGGRVRTDEVDGFLLDRGFQVFIEGYPEAKRQLNNKRLKLQRFDPGAVVRCDGAFHLVSDPLRKPEYLLEALKAPVGSLMDKIRVGLHRIAVIFQGEEEIFTAPEESTLDYLQGTLGLSSSIVSRFFAPFYQGIFLSPLDEQSSRMFEFVFKMFAVGSASLPEGGMGEVPNQIAAELPKDCVLLDTPVVAMKRLAGDDEGVGGSLLSDDEDGGDGDDQERGLAKRYGNSEDSPRVQLTLGGGGEVLAHTAVVATEAPAAAALLGGRVLEGGAKPTAGRSSTCLYFALDGPAPLDGPILLLNGEGTSPERPINNVVFLDKTAPSYAPKGKSLASVTVVGDPACSDDELENRVRAQLSEWFDSQSEGEGPQGQGASSDVSEGNGAPESSARAKRVAVEDWKHLRTYRVPYAQPAQKPPVGEGGFYGRSVELSEGIFVCGDHRATPTLDGAMRSGVLAAEAVVRSLLTGSACNPTSRQRAPRRRAEV